MFAAARHGPVQRRAITPRTPAMSRPTTQLPPENADIDRDGPQPQIHVEERRLKLDDFLKTAVKINGSDVHLQAGSIPMIRVDGKARFLDVPALSDELMKE